MFIKESNLLSFFHRGNEYALVVRNIDIEKVDCVSL